MNFYVNEILMNPETEDMYRILWIDEGNIIAFLIDLHDSKGLPFKQALNELTEQIITESLIKIKEDPFLIVETPEDISPKHIIARDEAWKVIEEMIRDTPAIFDKKKRSAYINDAMEKFEVTYPAVRKYLRKYWQRGLTINALLPDYHNSGAKGKERLAGTKKRGRPREYGTTEGANVNDQIKKVFRVALEKYYLNSNENRLTDAYKMMIKEFFVENIYYEAGIKKVIIKDENELPTLTQFKYWYKKEYDVVESTIARKGRKKYEKDYRAILDHSLSEVQGPGSRFQIDATVGDVFLLSKYNSNWIIGRPVIYVVIDVFSRMVVGLYIGLEGPSWLGASMAIANTVSDKQKFCADYGIHISKELWPCEHLPDVLLADRGEFEGYNVERLIEGFNLHVENAAPYRADWKGIVEKHFDVLQKKVKPMMPGYIDKDFQERGAKDYRLDATLTLEDFSKIIIKQILHYNQKHYLKDYVREQGMIQDDVQPIPLELWEWGIKNRSGKLRYFSDIQVKANLLPRGDATVTHKGLLFKNVYYSCNKAIEEMWFERSRKKSWKVSVAYDPRDMTNIFLMENGSIPEGGICEILPVSERFRRASLDEIIYLQKQEKQMTRQNEHSQLQKEVDYLAEVEAIVQDAEKKKQDHSNPSVSKRERVSAIKNHREQEKDYASKEEAFDFKEEKDNNQSADVISFNSHNGEEDYSRPTLKTFFKNRKGGETDE